MMYRYPPRDELIQQGPDSGRCLPHSGYDYGPLEVLPVLPGADLPFLELSWESRIDLNNRPVSYQCECIRPVRQWATHHEVIVAVDQKTHHSHRLPRR